MKIKFTNTFVTLVLGLLCFSSYQSLFAQKNISITGAQLFYGPNFHDKASGLDMEDGKLTVVGIDHYSTWAYGDNIFFASLFSGKFLDASGNPSEDRFKTYAEWHPRVSFSKVFKTRLATSKSFPIGIKDIALAAQLNQGNNYQARMIGLSADVKLPLFNLLMVSGYYRQDNFDRKGYQVTTFFGMPVHKSKRFEFTAQGFFDVYNTKESGVDFLAQAGVSWTISKLIAPNSQNAVKIGVDLFYHKTETTLTNTPLFILRWSW